MRVNLHFTINARDQLRLSFQPMLQLLSGLRASVDGLKSVLAWFTPATVVDCKSLGIFCF
jgi:hypothetical protein